MHRWSKWKQRVSISLKVDFYHEVHTPLLQKGLTTEETRQHSFHGFLWKRWGQKAWFGHKLKSRRCVCSFLSPLDDQYNVWQTVHVLSTGCFYQTDHKRVSAAAKAEHPPTNHPCLFCVCMDFMTGEGETFKHMHQSNYCSFALYVVTTSYFANVLSHKPKQEIGAMSCSNMSKHIWKYSK